MYKCGWNGCEKAYGTLNHLNAHVTMQSHGTKRTPEGKTYEVLVFVVAQGSPELGMQDAVSHDPSVCSWSRSPCAS